MCMMMMADGGDVNVDVAGNASSCQQVVSAMHVTETAYSATMQVMQHHQSSLMSITSPTHVIIRSCSCWPSKRRRRKPQSLRNDELACNSHHELSCSRERSMRPLQQRRVSTVKTARVVSFPMLS